jgi:hypothetical protein
VKLVVTGVAMLSLVRLGEARVEGRRLNLWVEETKLARISLGAGGIGKPRSLGFARARSRVVQMRTLISTAASSSSSSSAAGSSTST